MISTFQVLWTLPAEQDVHEIIAFIAQENPIAAKKVLDQFKEQAMRLECCPERGRVVPELKEQGLLQYRELIISHWRLIYRIHQNQVLVLTVLDARRNVKDILLESLLRNEN